MTFTASKRRTAFTLLELTVSTGLAMVIVGLTASAFHATRKAISRSEATLALNDEAQAIYLLLETSLTSMQQTCAMLAYAEPRTSPAPASASAETGRTTLVFMTALEQKDNYQMGSASQNLQTWDRSHLCWEAWRWQRGTQTLHVARNRQMRQNVFEQDARGFSITNAPDRPSYPQVAFTPDASAGVSYYGTPFRTVTQPRRYLDPIHPFGGPDPTDPSVSRLDDNMWFPDTTTPTYPDPDPTTGITKSRLEDGSTYQITEDVGDWSDLAIGLRSPTFDQVSNFEWEVVSHDESLPVVRIDDDANASTPPVSVVWQGVWLDGRMGTSPNTHLGASYTYAASEVAKRPKLIRVRFTLTHAKISVSQTYSFSFALPDLAPRQ